VSIDVDQTYLSEDNDPISLRISYESAGNSSGDASNHENDFLFMNTMLQDEDNLFWEVGGYRKLLENQARTIKNLKRQLKKTESKVSSFLELYYRKLY
jgi:hypothetical protein